jgi:membrane protein
MKPVLIELKRRIGLHNVAVTAAGIAFYGLLTLIPVLTALVASYALVFSDASEIESQVRDATAALDAETQKLISDLITDIVESMQGSATTVIVGSIVIALFTASGTVQKLLGAVNLAYETVETRPGWIVRLMSFVFTTAAIVLLVLMISLVGALPLVLDRLDLGSAAEIAIGLARLPVALLLFICGVTVLYRYGPRRDARTAWLNPGSFVAAGLFVLFSLGLSFYTSNVGALPASYGLLGSIAVLMLFMQLAALSVIVGAELNASAEHQLAGEELPADGTGMTTTPGNRNDVEPLTSGKAIAGLVALFIFGRGRRH